jgi:pimeloyl-ACP methyl ester carboxylesterase
MGHAVSTPTLTGVGERKHLLSPGVDLDTHVEDTVAHIEMEGLSDIVLVGCSSGGMVISGVLARVQERIASMVYLDAFLPERGKPQIDYMGYPRLEDFLERKEPVPPLIPLEVFGVKDQAVIDFVAPRVTPHPFMAFAQPSKALTERPSNIPHAYIRCTAFNNPSFDAFFKQAKRDPIFETYEIPTSHVAMLTDPGRSVEVLASLP